MPNKTYLEQLAEDTYRGPMEHAICEHCKFGTLADQSGIYCWCDKLKQTILRKGHCEAWKNIDA